MENKRVADSLDAEEEQDTTNTKHRDVKAGKDGKSSQDSQDDCKDTNLANLFVYFKGFADTRYQVELLKAMHLSFRVKREYEAWGKRPNFEIYVPATAADMETLCNYFQGDVPLSAVKQRIQDELCLEHEQQLEQEMKQRQRRSELETAVRSAGLVANVCRDIVKHNTDVDLATPRDIWEVRYHPLDFCRRPTDDPLRLDVDVGDKELLAQVVIDLLQTEMERHRIGGLCEMVEEHESKLLLASASSSSSSSLSSLTPAPRRPGERLVHIHFDEGTLRRWESVRYEMELKRHEEKRRLEAAAFERDCKATLPAIVDIVWKRFEDYASRAVQSLAFKIPFQFPLRDEYFDTSRVSTDLAEQLYTQLEAALQAKCETAQLDVASARVTLDRDLRVIKIQCDDSNPLFLAFQGRRHGAKLESELKNTIEAASMHFVPLLQTHLGRESSAATSTAGPIERKWDHKATEFAYVPRMWFDEKALRAVEGGLQTRLRSELQPSLKDVVVTSRFFKHELMIRVNLNN